MRRMTQRAETMEARRESMAGKRDPWKDVTIESEHGDFVVVSFVDTKRRDPRKVYYVTHRSMSYPKALRCVGEILADAKGARAAMASAEAARDAEERPVSIDVPKGKKGADPRLAAFVALGIPEAKARALLAAL